MRHAGRLPDHGADFNGIYDVAAQHDFRDPTLESGYPYLSELDIRVRQEDVQPALAWLHEIRRQAFSKPGSRRNATVSVLPATGNSPLSAEHAVEMFDAGLRPFAQVASGRLLPGDTPAVRAAIAVAVAATQRDRMLAQGPAGTRLRQRA